MDDDHPQTMDWLKATPTGIGTKS